MQSSPSDGHFRRSASTVHNATLKVATASSSVACKDNGAKRSTSLTHASAHQPAPHTSNAWDKRCALSPARLASCKRHAPTNPATPSTNGVQNSPWANGRKPSSSMGSATRNNAPPSHCTAKAVNTNVREGRRKPTSNVTNPATAQLIAVPWAKKNSGASR
ncbi:hypothetical protein D3C87_1252570 [compost metagenome]